MQRINFNGTPLVAPLKLEGIMSRDIISKLMVRIYFFTMISWKIELRVYQLGQDVKKDAGNVFLILVAFIVASLLFGFVGGLMGVSTKLEFGLSVGFVIFIVIFYVVFSFIKSKTKIGAPIQ